MKPTSSAEQRGRHHIDIRTTAKAPFRGFIFSSVTVLDETHFLGRAAWTYILIYEPQPRQNLVLVFRRKDRAMIRYVRVQRD